MNIGIIVYSHTGNTLSVAEKVRARLAAKGHHVSLERVELEGDPKKATTSPKLKSCPDPSPYDAVVFASPVQAFSLARPMGAYMERMPAIGGKRAACFVTKGSKRLWLGGNRAIKRMTRLCEAKGARVAATGIVVWTDELREKHTAEVVERVAGAF